MGIVVILQAAATLIDLAQKYHVDPSKEPTQAELDVVDAAQRIVEAKLDAPLPDANKTLTI